MKDGHSPDRRRAIGGARRLALLGAFVLALLSQSIVTQSHVHPGAFDPRTAIGRHVAALTGGAAHHESPPCPFCREKAQAGSYLTPSPMLWVAGFPAPFAVAACWFAGRAHRTHRHGWRSRAPPAG